ncbi:MAG: D-alanyl-D-alanine carboxypeptidase [Treponema sp.]|nr:D-alanyl-D-alanine carboxypeptidase [Treponema sp.]
MSLPLCSAAAQENVSELVINSEAGVLMDATTGTVLFEKNGDAVIPPASLTKLMTIHIALTEVAAGKASLDEIVDLPRQSWAANQLPGSSLMSLAAGHIVTLRELILGLAIPSGNDAAMAVGLRFAPTIEAFVEQMNLEAQGFGLSNTLFVDPSGWSEHNLTTAKEFAYFCREYLKLHSETLGEYHSIRDFTYPKPENLPPAYRLRPNTLTKRNGNTLLGSFEGVDGLKTGFIPESGYNIALTAERDQTRFIGIILGGTTTRSRDDDGRKLLAWGFEHFKTLRPVMEPLPPLRIWKGKEDSVDITTHETMEFTVAAERGNNLRWETELADPVIAPLPANSLVGELILWDDIGELRRFPLLTTAEAERGGFFKRLWDGIRLFFRSLKNNTN